MDGYHAGFPCTMFSTVWAEETAPIGNKLNVMKGRYLRAEPSTWRRQLQSVGKFTRYCRCLRWRIHLPVIACNISRPGNFRKWTSSFNNFRYYARFNTCRYETGIEVGKRHFKPQQFAGSLVCRNSKACECGKHAKHEPTVGPAKSKASAEYPEELCREQLRHPGHLTVKVKADGKRRVPSVEDGMPPGHYRPGEGGSCGKGRTH